VEPKEGFEVQLDSVEGEWFAGRIETHATGRRQYDLHTDILQCDAVGRVRSETRSWVGTGPNKMISQGDVASALGDDTLSWRHTEPPAQLLWLLGVQSGFYRVNRVNPLPNNLRST
jgi:hypothetical protein